MKIATGVIDAGGNFAAGIVDTSETGGKICPPVSWYRCCTLTCKYLRKFLKKFETTLLEYSGAGGKLIHEKKPEAKKLVTLSL
jgi:hypothetical protein